MYHPSPTSPAKNPPSPFLVDYSKAKAERRNSTYSNRSSSSDNHAQYLTSRLQNCQRRQSFPNACLSLNLLCPGAILPLFCPKYLPLPSHPSLCVCPALTHLHSHRYSLQQSRQIPNDRPPLQPSPPRRNGRRSRRPGLSQPFGLPAVVIVMAGVVVAIISTRKHWSSGGTSKRLRTCPPPRPRRPPALRPHKGRSGALLRPHPAPRPPHSDSKVLTRLHFRLLHLVLCPLSSLLLHTLLQHRRLIRLVSPL
jgi:hypothetical protein